jgi:hypothetical protein
MITVRSEEGAELTITPRDTTAEPRSGEERAATPFLAYPGLPEVRLGVHLIGIDRGVPTWDGGYEIPPGFAAEPLSSPRIPVLPNQEATLRASYPQVEYLELRGDGSYVLRTTERKESPRIAIDLVVVPGSDPGLVELRVAFALAVMTGREPLEGTELDVGRPIIVTNTFDTRLEMRLGEWRLLSAQLARPAGTEPSQYLLVFLSVDRPPAPAAPAHPPGRLP